MKLIKHISLAAAFAAIAAGALAKDASGLKVYINPGHGGHDADDRNVTIAPYAQGDPNGYWESNSNLSKGLQLRDMLEAKGYTVVMSRVTNTSADDLPLSTIVRLSNESKADIFFSIHSNATGTVARRNFPLMLFRGYDNEPVKPEDKVVCNILNKYLLQNKATYWTSTNLNVRGDFSFYPSWNGAGLGVLRGNTVTGMLSEGSFHDYIPEAYRLMSDDFCWLEAWHFRKTIDEYFGVDGVDYGVVCGRLNDTRVPRDGEYITYGDDKLATIQNAKVELLDANENVVQTYTTHAIHTNGFYLFKNVAPGKYKIRASVETHMPVESSELTVVADEVSYCNLSMSKVRTTPPAVESYSPVWNEGDEALLCNTPITVQFNWDMDTEETEKAFSIEPPVEGVFTWEDLNHRLVFTPTTPYQISTLYTVRVSTSAKHGGGMAMENPLEFKFFTTDRNYMQILGSFPKEGEEVHYQGATIEFRFDKLPNTSLILKQVTCTDSKGEAVSFNNRKMSSSKKGAAYGFFRIPFLKDLTVGESYNLHVSGEFADKDGITIQAPVDITFKAVNAGEDKANTAVLDDMDNVGYYTFDPASSVNVESAEAIKGSEKLFGDASVAFSYTFNSEEGGEARFSRASQEHVLQGTEDNKEVTPGEPIGVHIYGDLTGNQVYLELASEVSTTYTHVCNMDFLGWRYITVNANCEADADISGIKVVQTTSQMSHNGTFYIDNILTGSQSGVADIVSDSTVTVYPNPAAEYVIANAGTTIHSVELVGMNGLSVAKASGNVLNVSELPEGNYIVLVETGSGRTAKRVVVKH